MRCRYCGTEVPDYQSFCPECGWPVDDNGGNSPKPRPNTLVVVLGVLAVVVLVIGAFFAGRILPDRHKNDTSTDPQGQSAVVIPYTTPGNPNPAAPPVSNGGTTPTGSYSGTPANSGQSQPVLPTQSTQTATPYIPVQTATPYVPSSQKSSYYLLPDSDSRYLTEADLKNLSWRELSLARNEIYARHGRRFANAEIQAYFDTQDWYYGTIAPADFQPGWLSTVEYANIKLIKDYENKVYGGNYF